mgnify:FL=1
MFDLDAIPEASEDDLLDDEQDMDQDDDLGDEQPNLN